MNTFHKCNGTKQNEHNRIEIIRNLFVQLWWIVNIPVHTPRLESSEVGMFWYNRCELISRNEGRGEKDDFTTQARKTYFSALRGATKYVFLAFDVKSSVRN